MSPVEPIRTANGTVIERCRSTGVGKLIGKRLYIHRDYASGAIVILTLENPELRRKFADSLKWKKREFPLFGFRCVRLDLRSGAIRFDRAPDFCTAREPMVGDWLTVNPDRHWTRGHSKAIWHNKWLWVKPDCSSFDVGASMEWSRKYYAILNEIPKGSARLWKSQLAKVGLQ